LTDKESRAFKSRKLFYVLYLVTRTD